jgi:GNAT superfamily N-acetyltransferase
VEVIEGYRIGNEGIDVDLVFRWLSEDSYWAAGRSHDTVARSLSNSYCLGAFTDDGDGNGQLVGFARTITDWTTFGWIADVYIDRGHRGRGLGRLLVGTLRNRLEEAGVPRLILATLDAHGVYAALGFVPVAHPERWMEIDKR